MAAEIGNVAALAPEQLHHLLQDGAACSVLLVDCRPPLAFNISHVSASHNLYFPTIIKRRSKGHIALENVVHCDDTRRRLLEGQFDVVVLYDDNAQVYSISDIETKSELYLCLKCLYNSGISSKIAVVQGGYNTLQTYFPHLCSVSHDQGGLAPCSGEEDFWSFDNEADNQRVPNQQDPQYVLPWLYIGDAEHACSLDRLDALGITAILNVSKNACSSPQGFRSKQIPVSDSLNSDLLHWFPETNQFIESVRQEQGKVLVHCQAGISRSATVCIAYLMYQNHLGLEDAFDMLKAHRRSINPNLNFMQQLKMYEAQLGLLTKDAQEENLCNTVPDLTDILMHSPTTQLQEVPVSVADTSTFFTTEDTL